MVTVSGDAVSIVFCRSQSPFRWSSADYKVGKTKGAPVGAPLLWDSWFVDR